MSDALAAPPREQGWTRIVIALVAFLLLSHAPVVRAAAPVVDTLVLLVPALAACFIAGWRKGGSLALALAWAALAGLLLAMPVAPRKRGVRGSRALVGSARGRRARPRVHSRLAAAVSRPRARGSRDRGADRRDRHGVRAARGRSHRRRVRAGARSCATRPCSRSGRTGFRTRAFAPSMREWAARARARSCSRRRGAFAVLLYPALLALESLAACALAWGLYHRMSRARLGAALAPLRYFRFSDELIWALVAGMTITVLPTLDALRVFGANLVVFFGALYALRGFGVIAWFYPQLTLGAQLAASFAAVVLFPVSLAARSRAGRYRYVDRLAAAHADGETRLPAPAPPDSSLEDQPFDRSTPMEVILKQAIDNLGQPGDIVMVSPGYGRNFLLPRGLAYEATPGNRKRIEREKAHLEAAENERRTQAQTLAEPTRAGVAHLLRASRRRGQAVRLGNLGGHRAAAARAGLPGDREAPDRPSRADQGAWRLQDTRFASTRT